MMSGAAITPTTVTTNSSAPSVPATPATSSRTSSSPRLTLYSEITGTKDCENAPLREQAAQEVWDLVGDQERVHERPGAEGLGLHHLAQEAGDARQQRREAGEAGLLEDGAAHLRVLWRQTPGLMPTCPWNQPLAARPTRPKLTR